MDVSERLSEALNTGEVVEVIYHGGSKPGTTREIAIQNIDGDVVRAYCHETKRSKLFRIDRIEIPADAAVFAGLKNRSERDEFDECQTLSGLHELLLERLVTMGWHVILQPDGIELRRMAKNGKRPLKHPTVGIYHCPEQVSTEYNAATGERYEITKPTENKWYLAGDKKGQRYKVFNKAIRAFFKWAQESAPNHNKARKP